MKKLIIIITLPLILFTGCSETEESNPKELLQVYIDGSCEGKFYTAEGTITEIAGSWATNPFSIAPLDTLEFELPNAGNYRIYLTATYNSGEEYYWDKTITMNEGDWMYKGFNCSSE